MSITKIIICLFVLMSQDMICFSLMIDPAGDAHYTGRKIGNTLERSITMQMAQQLKEKLEEKFLNVSVTLTRAPGEVIHPLQNANFANRLPTDLYINLSCFTDPATKPNLFIYRYTNQLAFLPPPSLTTFIPFNQAFLINAHLTTTITQMIKKELQAQQVPFSVKGVYAFPFKPLVGIISPAFCLECGLNDENQWQHYVSSLFLSISTVIEHLEQKLP